MSLYFPILNLQTPFILIFTWLCHTQRCYSFRFPPINSSFNSPVLNYLSAIHNKFLICYINRPTRCTFVCIYLFYNFYTLYMFRTTISFIIRSSWFTVFCSCTNHANVSRLFCMVCTAGLLILSTGSFEATHNCL